MSIARVSLDSAEKTKLIKYLNESKVLIDKKRITLEREQLILEKCRVETPPNAPPNWIEGLERRARDWQDKINHVLASVGDYDLFINAINNSTEIKVKGKGNIFRTLFEQEMMRKQVEPIYRYYPRIKKAKEAALYVFANKIKTIMESENVKIA